MTYREFSRYRKFFGKKLNCLLGDKPHQIVAKEFDIDKKFRFMAYRFNLRIFDISDTQKSISDVSGRLLKDKNTLFWEPYE